MKIRFAEEKDVNQIIELCKQHAGFENSAYNSENKKERLSKSLFKSENILKCLVVEVDTEIVGYATFMKQFSTWDAEFYVYLDCLFFIERIRGKSLGTQLMEEIKKYAELEGCREIQWQTPGFNKRAIDFYQKIGAESKTKERFFWEVYK